MVNGDHSLVNNSMDIFSSVFQYALSHPVSAVLTLCLIAATTVWFCLSFKRISSSEVASLYLDFFDIISSPLYCTYGKQSQMLCI